MESANSLQKYRIHPVGKSREPRTLVLFGKVGNGKSDLGNSITGKTEFLSRVCASGVTTTCKLEITTLDDGQVVNVIDTPGLFDPSRGHDYYTREMVNCITLAKRGIDGFILVCSIRTRFSSEEEDVLRSLKEIFDDRIINYMIVAFTGGDELDTTFHEYLSTCPPSLQRVLQLCNNRVILFDNKTKEETQRKSQVQQLMTLVQSVRDENNGKSYTGDVVEMIKNAHDKDEAKKLMMRGAQEKQVVHYKAQLKPFDEAPLLRKQLDAALHTTQLALHTSQLDREKIEKLERENEMLKDQTPHDRRGQTSMLDIIYLLADKNCTIM
ncbi:hypothetical protein MKX03_013958 [Papaver bracteatum]|nr:hypothetical protein MKX03_013958 [Papaver bracteatum]